MNIESLIDSSPLPIGEIVTVEGTLMDNAHRPFIGKSTTDWSGNRCIRLADEWIFDLLVDLLFPHMIGGSTTSFLNPVFAVGRLERNEESRGLVLLDVQSIRIDISHSFNLSGTKRVEVWISWKCVSSGST